LVISSTAVLSRPTITPGNSNSPTAISRGGSAGATMIVMSTSAGAETPSPVRTAYVNRSSPPCGPAVYCTIAELSPVETTRDSFPSLGDVRIRNSTCSFLPPRIPSGTFTVSPGRTEIVRGTGGGGAGARSALGRLRSAPDAGTPDTISHRNAAIFRAMKGNRVTGKSAAPYSCPPTVGNAHSQPAPAWGMKSLCDPRSGPLPRSAAADGER
jgi:hypothetical protein